LRSSSSTNPPNWREFTRKYNKEAKFTGAVKIFYKWPIQLANFYKTTETAQQRKVLLERYSSEVESVLQIRNAAVQGLDAPSARGPEGAYFSAL
jgi:hypothetical protein